MAAPDGPHKLAAEVRRIIGDRLDILVANAGIANDATIENTTVADFDALFAVNVRAPFFLVQQLLPILGKGSSVVLLSSLAAHASVGTLSAYAATKGAIDTLVKHFAAALGERGIRVNAVAPGVVDTDMSSFAQDGCGPRFHAEPASHEARRAAGRHRRCDRLPRLGRGPLDHRRHAAGRWRLEALTIRGSENDGDDKGCGFASGSLR